MDNRRRELEVIIGEVKFQVISIIYIWLIWGYSGILTDNSSIVITSTQNNYKENKWILIKLSDVIELKVFKISGTLVTISSVYIVINRGYIY